MIPLTTKVVYGVVLWWAVSKERGCWNSLLNIKTIGRIYSEDHRTGFFSWERAFFKPELCGYLLWMAAQGRERQWKNANSEHAKKNRTATARGETSGWNEGERSWRYQKSEQFGISRHGMFVLPMRCSPTVVEFLVSNYVYECLLPV